MIIGYLIIHFLIHWILASLVNAEIKEWKITNDTCEINDTVTRAVGINFTAVITRICDELRDVSCYAKYSVAGHKDGKIAIDNLSPYKSSGKLTVPNQDMTVLYTYMKVDDMTNHPRIIWNFTAVPPSEQEFVLNLRSNLCTNNAVKTVVKVNFVGCRNQTEFHVTLLNKSSIARYLDKGHIICIESENGRAVFNNNSEARQTQCLADASWRYASNITCIYPTTAKLHIDGKPYMETVDLMFNQSSDASNEAFMQCDRHDGDRQTTVPVAVLVQPQLEMNKNNSLISIHPNNNGANVSCYFENRYTKIFGPYLSTSILNILFGPYPPRGFDSLCYFQNGSIKFYSNPASTENTLSLWQDKNEKIPATITESDEMDYGVFAQLITPNMSITGADIRLQRNYSGKIEHFNVTPCQNVPTTTQVTGTTLPTKFHSTSPQDVLVTKSKDFTAVVILCVGIFLLMAFTIIIICRLSRRNKEKSKHGDDKLENFNPLYDQSRVTKVVPKENDQVNPLYETTDVDKCGSDVYSVVDKKKAPQKSNKSVTSDVETYAVVDRKNKKATDPQKSTESVTSEVETYAVVDRKNKKVTGAPKATKSTSSDVAIYAVIDRKNKKAKGAQKSKKSTESTTSDVATAVMDRTNKTPQGEVKSTGSTIPDIETYAVVDRQKKKGTGVGYDDTRGPRKK